MASDSSKLKVGKDTTPEKPQTETTKPLGDDKSLQVERSAPAPDDRDYVKKLKGLKEYLEGFVGKSGYNPFFWIKKNHFNELYDRFVEGKGTIRPEHKREVEMLDEKPDVKIYDMAPDLTRARGKRNRISG